MKAAECLPHDLNNYILNRTLYVLIGNVLEIHSSITCSSHKISTQIPSTEDLNKSIVVYSLQSILLYSYYTAMRKESQPHTAKSAALTAM